MGGEDGGGRRGDGEGEEEGERQLAAAAGLVLDALRYAQVSKETYRRPNVTWCTLSYGKRHPLCTGRAQVCISVKRDL